MSEAAVTLAALEECRHAALQRLTALDGERPGIAFNFCATNSTVALQRWRELDEEADRLIERLRLFDAALHEAREASASALPKRSFSDRPKHFDPAGQS
jgi:hypothetical protein